MGSPTLEYYAWLVRAKRDDIRRTMRTIDREVDRRLVHLEKGKTGGVDEWVYRQIFASRGSDRPPFNDDEIHYAKRKVLAHTLTRSKHESSTDTLISPASLTQWLFPPPVRPELAEHAFVKQWQRGCNLSKVADLLLRKVRSEPLILPRILFAAE